MQTSGQCPYPGRGDQNSAPVLTTCLVLFGIRLQEGTKQEVGYSIEVGQSMRSDSIKVVKEKKDERRQWETGNRRAMRKELGCNCGREGLGTLIYRKKGFVCFTAHNRSKNEKRWDFSCHFPTVIRTDGWCLLTSALIMVSASLAQLQSAKHSGTQFAWKTFLQNNALIGSVQRAPCDPMGLCAGVRLTTVIWGQDQPLKLYFVAVCANSSDDEPERQAWVRGCKTREKETILTL